MAWCFSTRAPVATVMSTLLCFSSFLWVKRKSVRLQLDWWAIVYVSSYWIESWNMTLQFKCGDTYSYHFFYLDQIIKSGIHSYHYFFHINKKLTVLINLLVAITLVSLKYHGEVIKWKHFPRFWPFVQGINQSPVISPNKGGDLELWCFPWTAPE